MISAEIEQLIVLSLIKQSDLEIFTGLKLISRTSTNLVFDKLQYFVEMEANREKAERLDELKSWVDKFSKIRNVLAHASYMYRVSYLMKDTDYIF